MAATKPPAADIRALKQGYPRPEDLKAALERRTVAEIRAGYGTYILETGRSSQSPVSRSIMKAVPNRSRLTKAVLIEAVIAVVFDLPLPEAAKPLTKEERAEKKARAEAARVAAELEAMKFKPPKGPLATLTEEQARYLSEQVMQHPGGCKDGKREFIERLGLPKLPPVVRVSLSMDVVVSPLDVVKDGISGRKLSPDARRRLISSLTAALPDEAALLDGCFPERIVVRD